ncbi:MAG: deoxyguanosinetriphosphate triphosphohydrolase [Candidatus Omnitrophota bacterium]
MNKLFFKDEKAILASYAVKSIESKGRRYPEKEHLYRSVFQRDKDRISYSTAFRRLQYKTQVFVNHEGDHYRTRLTHTLEVFNIARTIARALRLNEDLVEAIALAHDIGHTPFGHSGEKALYDLMKEHGGFEHNRQGLRVVDELEERYHDFKGLNLTWEVREGIIKHTTTYDNPKPSDFDPEKQSSLEAQVVNAADEIAYDSHDLEDGLTANLIHEEQLAGVKLWEDAKADYHVSNISRKIMEYQIVRHLIDLQVTDLIKTSLKNLKKVKSLREVRDAKMPLVVFSKEMCQLRKPLKQCLFDNLYNHYRVVRMSDKAYRFLTAIFDVYFKRPEQLPSGPREKLQTESLHRVICDYIAGMTDRFALDEYKKLFEPYERV